MHGKMVFKYNHSGNRILQDKNIVCLNNEAKSLVFFYISSPKDIQVAK